MNLANGDKPGITFLYIFLQKLHSILAVQLEDLGISQSLTAIVHSASGICIYNSSNYPTSVLLVTILAHVLTLLHCNNIQYSLFFLLL